MQITHKKRKMPINGKKPPLQKDTSNSNGVRSKMSDSISLEGELHPARLTFQRSISDIIYEKENSSLNSNLITSTNV